MVKGTHGGSARTAFPFPINSAQVERASIAISTSDAYLPDTSIFASEKDKMEHAKERMKEYKKH